MDSQPEDSIADRHARWIRRGGVGVTVLLALLAFVLPMMLGLSYLTSAALSFGVYIVSAVALTRLLAMAATRIFVEKFRTASLRTEPTVPDPRLESEAEWFRMNGFVGQGSWKVVGDDGVVYGSVGSRLFHRSDYAIHAYLDRTQMAFSTALSDGRVLITTSVGAMPHPKALIQGMRDCSASELYELHGDGLRHLHGKGISAVEPPGGPVELQLQLDRLEQDYLNTMSVAEGAAATLAMIKAPLGRISDEP